MNVEIKCFATLSGKGACNFKTPVSINLPNQSKVKDALSKLGMSQGDVKLAFVNSRSVDVETPLAEGDKIGLFPPVGGM